MAKYSLSVVYLHENEEYLQECAELLNEQWKRSPSARFQSLENSSKELPNSIILVEEINGVKCVIGHSRLSRVLEDNKGCWIGSVVIAQEKQKRGYGRYLMKKSEEYARSLNFTTMYLNTRDQQGFYEHLGYQYCEPVSTINFKPKDIWMEGLFNSIKKKQPQQQPHLNENRYEKSYNKMNKEIIPIECKEQSNCCALPPPSPLPVPKMNLLMKEVSTPIKFKQPHLNENQYEKSYNKINKDIIPVECKEHCCVPPPPPPLPILEVIKKTNVENNLEHYWMKKSL